MYWSSFNSTPAQTHTDSHSVFKFRKQLCQCVRLTDGQTDCQPHCVSVSTLLLRFIFLFIHLHFVTLNCCCPALLCPDRHKGNQHLRHLCKQDGGSEGGGGRKERRRWKEKSDSLYSYDFSPPSLRSLCP